MPVITPSLLLGHIGFGDVIKRVTSTFDIKPCGGCEGRVAALNRRFVFTGRAK